MPTGYTAAILERDIDFPTFAMDCARGMGACIMLRDDGGGGEKIPEKFEARTWNQEQLLAAEARIEKVKAMSQAECATAAREEYEQGEADRKEGLREANQAIKRIEAMIAKVNAWNPPTPDHVNFKKFMLEQLEMTLSSDGKWRLEYYSAPCREKTAEGWRAAQIESALHDIGYHTKAHAEEVSRTNSRTEWVQQLRKSLKVS